MQPFGQGTSANLLAGNRLFLQQGPINLIIKAYGTDEAIRATYWRARDAFAGLLEELVDELPILRQPIVWDNLPNVSGATAQRMISAITPFRDTKLTPMVAVAGAVADQVAMTLHGIQGIDKLFVNNSGDIAIWLRPGETLDIGVVAKLSQALPTANLKLRCEDGVGGIATSGWDGHSFSLGIADAVTVLAENAATADAAATLIGNAVNAEYPGIERKSAQDIDPNTDLGDCLVTTAVSPLPQATKQEALDAGLNYANALVHKHQIKAAFITLQGQWRNTDF